MFYNVEVEYFSNFSIYTMVFSKIHSTIYVLSAWKGLNYLTINALLSRSYNIYDIGRKLNFVAIVQIITQYNSLLMRISW